MMMPRLFAESAFCAGEGCSDPTLKPICDNAGPNWRAHCTRKLRLWKLLNLWMIPLLGPGRIDRAVKQPDYFASMNRLNANS